jgi:hypothetical protein
MDINRLSDTRQLLAQPESNTDIDQIAAHGVVAGNTDMYTYIPDQEPTSEFSRHSSASLSTTGSPNPQHVTGQSQASSSRAKVKESVPCTVITSAPVTIPIHTRQNPQQMYWSGKEPQSHNLQGLNLPQHQDALVGAPLGLMPINQSSESTQAAEQNFQGQISGMGYISTGMSMNLGMGIDNMDLDAANANFWWDQPFEDIPVDHYNIWSTESYQNQGYMVPDINGYYQP